MTFHDSASSGEHQPSFDVETLAEVGVNPSQQRAHRPLLMVARDVGVQVEPGALDSILVRAVRRQKVKLEPAPMLRGPDEPRGARFEGEHQHDVAKEP